MLVMSVISEPPGPRVDVSHYRRAIRKRTITAPELESMHIVIGGKKQCRTDHHRALDVRRPCARMNVQHQDRSVRRSVALPEFGSVAPVIRGKEHSLPRWVSGGLGSSRPPPR